MQKLALTDQVFWNDKWNNLKVEIIPEGHYYFGRRGLFMRMIEREVGTLKGKLVIEIGGAGSYRLLALAKWGGAVVTALDYSEVGMSKTQQIFDINGCEVKTIVSDFFEWEPDRHYDIVVHWGVLEHFTDPLPFLARCSKLLSFSSKMVFSMPNMSAWGAYFWKKWSSADYSRHIYHSYEEIKTACAKTDLEIKHAFYFDFPLLQITKWEKAGLGPLLVSVGQHGLNLLWKSIPIGQLGCKYISSNRGFKIIRKSHCSMILL